jgi:acyl-CoA thioester hydrolase
MSMMPLQVELLFDVALIDMDPFFIHYTAYPNWMDRGFMALLKGAGHPLGEIFAEGYGFPLVKCQVDYLAPARLDDRVRLSVWVSRLGTTSMTVSYAFDRLQPDGLAERLAQGETVHVCVASATRRPRPLPEWLRVAVAQQVGGRG